MASSLQPETTSAPLNATLSAQIIMHTIKLQPSPEFKGEIDYKVIEAWIYSADNYFMPIGLADLSQ